MISQLILDSDPVHVQIQRPQRDHQPWNGDGSGEPLATGIIMFAELHDDDATGWTLYGSPHIPFSIGTVDLSLRNAAVYVMSVKWYSLKLRNVSPGQLFMTVSQICPPLQPLAFASPEF